MRLSVLELPARFGRPAEQLELARRLLAAGPRPDLALLPEAALTGYVAARRAPDPFDLRPYAEPEGGPLEQGLAALAREVGAVVVGPHVLREGERCFNALVALGPDGAPLFRYRKRHPWFPEAWASPGEAPMPVVELGGRRVTAAICFDVHFLEAECARELAAAELLLFASAWVEEEDGRPALLGGLARRTGLWIANANWGPGVPAIAGQGGSAFFDPTGAPRGALVATETDGGLVARRLDVEVVG